ncbi:MAG TPA: MFS transporter [bacterium]|nr:MFS transporter [bacterium]
MFTGVIRQSLKYSYKDGLFFSIMFGVGDLFLMPYCVMMSASARQVALLAALPGLVGALSQLFTSEAIDLARSRRRIIVGCILLQALMWLPILLVPYLFGRSIALLIAFVVVYAALGAFCLPAWSSMMAEYIPVRSRGKYFGWRSKTLGLVIVGSSFLAGSVLWLFGRGNLIGYSVIFAVAFASRMASWYFLTRMFERRYRPAPEARFTFWQFVRRAGKSNFANFTLIVGGMSCAVNIASPFFAVYMLRDLQFNYMTYTVISLSATLTGLVMMERWGRHADVVGNVRVIKSCALFLPVIPVLWLFSHNILYLIVIQVFSGFFWAGFNMCVSNFIYDAVVSPAKRSRCIAYYNVINGAGLFIGAQIGGYLATHLPWLFEYRIMTLFLLSGLMRLVPALFARLIREVRVVRHVGNAELFYSMFGLKKTIVTDID